MRAGYKNGGLVQYRDGKLKPLLDAERQAFGLGINDTFEIITR